MQYIGSFTFIYSTDKYKKNKNKKMASTNICTNYIKFRPAYNNITYT